jgi:ice-binding like protein/Big-like domain-containing protein
MLQSAQFRLRLSRLVAFFPLLLASACSDEALVLDPEGSSGAGTGGTTTSGNGGASGSGNGGRSGGGGRAGASGGAAGSMGGPIIEDNTAPTVVSTYPDDEATGESSSATISVRFSEAMAPLTLTDATFLLERGDVAIAGAVTYFNREAIFVPTADLDLNTTYTATITTQAEDLAGNELDETYTWSFETDATAALGPAPVLLGAAGKFAVLAKSAISNVPTSVITGDLGLSPAAASYVTGFSLTRAGTKWSSPQVVGDVFAADNDPPTPTDLTTAVGNMEAAYTDAAGRPTPTFLDLGAGAIGGLTLSPGLYKWTSTVTIPTDVTISGAANDVWIFQVSDDLTLSAAKNMILIGGARAKNIFWQVAGTVDLGTTSHAEGIILSQTAIQLGTGASINGRLLAQTAVSLAGATVTEPSP